LPLSDESRSAWFVAGTLEFLPAAPILTVVKVDSRRLRWVAALLGVGFGVLAGLRFLIRGDMVISRCQHRV
jgi:hypothetical protein